MRLKIKNLQIVFPPAWRRRQLTGELARWAAGVREQCDQICLNNFTTKSKNVLYFNFVQKDCL
jgi:hypothetical protein